MKSHPSKLKQFSEMAHLGVKSDRCVCLYVCVYVCMFHSQGRMATRNNRVVAKMKIPFSRTHVAK